MSEDSFEILDPISVTAALPGWRAVLIFPGGGLLVEPLVGWGVFEVSDVLLNDNAAVQRRGRQIGGVISGEPTAAGTVSTVVTGAPAEYLAYHLAPGTPDPSSVDEARAQQRTQSA